MKWKQTVREPVHLTRTLLKWMLLSLPLGLCVGSGCALFLWLLEVVTALRFQHPWLLYCLPVAGAGISWVYLAVGRSVDRGNNLIMDEIHEPGGGVHWSMAPLILFSTVLTHLCGGSAGREGTAVQMGGSFASAMTKWLPGLDQQDRRSLLMAGVAAGFGGVFGTPVAGMVFAMEVLIIGRMNFAAALPCLAASLISDQVCLAWGIHHTHYSITSMISDGSQEHLAPIVPKLLFWTVVGGLFFGSLSRVFAASTHGLGQVFQKRIRNPLLRPVVGGMILILLVWLLGTRDYLGLGVSSPDENAVTILKSFEPAGAHPDSWFWKIAFTSITLSSEFKGGEVTPLFFIGATAGNLISQIASVPADLFAGLGFVAVFAGATNTPIACTIMAAELFGSEYLVYFMIACELAYLSSGQHGIYSSQRSVMLKSISKHHPAAPNHAEVIADEAVSDPLRNRG